GAVPRVFAATAPPIEVNLSSAVPQVEPAARGEAQRTVALVLSPVDAHVFREGKDLGAMPVTLSIAPGESVPIEVRRQGFWTRRATLDGSEGRVVIRLAPATGAPPPASAPLSAPSAPSPVPPIAAPAPVTGAI